MLDFFGFIFDITFEVLIDRVIWRLIKLIGSFFRYPFLCHKYSYKQVLGQEYNGRVGFIVICVLAALIATIVTR